MPRYAILGTEPTSGRSRRIAVDADDEEAARAYASRAGLFVTGALELETVAATVAAVEAAPAEPAPYVWEEPSHARREKPSIVVWVALTWSIFLGVYIAGVALYYTISALLSAELQSLPRR
jgi:hypothetical protein